MRGLRITAFYFKAATRMTESAEKLINSVKAKIARGEPTYSMTVRLVHSVEIAGIARAAGFDSIYIDLEHSALSLETVGQISIASLAMGVMPFVRVPGVDPQLITRILDSGALGIIVPDVHSAREAEVVVRAAKYRPIGERSLPGAMPQLNYRALPTLEATAEMNDAIMIVAMIESAAGLAAADEIAAVPGIDILLMGANDLCTEHGVPGQFDHPFVEQAYAEVQQICRDRGKTLGVGGLGSRPDLVKKYVALGGRYVSLGADLGMLLSAATQKLKEAT